MVTIVERVFQLVARKSSDTMKRVGKLVLLLPASLFAQTQSDYYRIETYELPKGVNFEASGLAVLPDGKLAVSLRKGEVWIAQNPSDSAKPDFKRFASGLHEILGLAWRDGALYATQRVEVTKLRDVNGDGVADEYLTAAMGWGVSGNYHEYAYGPVFDKAGNLYTSLNAGMGKGWKGAGEDATHAPWRGWVMRTTPEGKMEPWCAGFRSPCGIGQDADGEIFITDQQGNWMPTTPLFHIRKGAYFSHADSIADAMRPESPVKIAAKQADGITVAEAMKTVQGYTPPAVWLPYVKMGQSGTGITCDKSGGKFGPFEKQLFLGEFVLSGVNRVFLEKVGGEYQGACFPFVDGLQCAALALTTLPDGSLVVGESNRGWNSKGNRPFGLQKIVWTKKTPLEVQKMELTKSGFRFTFTLPVDKASVGELTGQSYTYPFQSKYGGEELDAKPLQITSSTLSDDGLSLEVSIANLRTGYVHEFELPQMKAKDGTLLWHRMAYYTVNRLKE
jgi:glucose/arabinose dehydrogenase